MLALILPVSTAVSVATVFTTLTSLQQVGREWRYVAWHQFTLIFLYSLVGIGLGLYCMKLLDEAILRHCMGVFLILYSIRALRAPKTSRLLPTGWRGVLAAAAGIIGGLFSALFGAGAGPIYVVYFDILRLERAVFRATISAVVVLGGAARIAGYGSSGFYGSSTIPLLVIGLPLVIVGSWLGDRPYSVSVPDRFPAWSRPLFCSAGSLCWQDRFACGSGLKSRDPQRINDTRRL